VPYAAPEPSLARLTPGVCVFRCLGVQVCMWVWVWLTWLLGWECVWGVGVGWNKNACGGRGHTYTHAHI
jgi:hypothetical protein